MFEGYDKNYRCLDCEDEFHGVPAKVDATECPLCGGALKHIGYRPPTCGVRDNPLSINPKNMVTSVGKKVRSVQAQEKLYGQIVEDGKKRYKKMMASGKAPEARMVARIPRELFLQRTRQYGKNFWYAGGNEKEQENILKREGLYWPEG